MTKMEITKRMEEIDRERFYLSMKDRWDLNDYDTDRALLHEYFKLNNLL